MEFGRREERPYLYLTESAVFVSCIGKKVGDKGKDH